MVKTLLHPGTLLYFLALLDMRLVSMGHVSVVLSFLERWGGRLVAALLTLTNEPNEVSMYCNASL